MLAWIKGRWAAVVAWWKRDEDILRTYARDFSSKVDAETGRLKAVYVDSKQAVFGIEKLPKV